MTTLKLLAEEIFDVIVKDLTSRKGFGYEWDRLDADVEKEIQSTNVSLILEILEKEMKYEDRN